MGTESICAVRMPVMVLVAPGPEVTRTTPGRPLARAKPSAMWVAPCSCRVSTSWMGESTRASNSGIAAPPGRPKTYFTPCCCKYVHHRLGARAGALRLRISHVETCPFYA